MKARYILGLSCYYHDSAATLLRDGEIVGAVHEERFSRIKHDAAFPMESIRYLLKLESIELSDIEAVVYYEKPFVTFERLLETHLNYAPFGFVPFLKSIPIWLKQKLFLEADLKKNLKKFGEVIPPIKYSEHHLSHAASAFYPSPFKDSAILCVDGVGEWATTSGWIGNEAEIKPIWEVHFPHSLGLFYSAITAYLGFKVNSGEYKVMGLAPYGEPIYAERILQEMIHLHQDGSYSLNMEYFEYGHKLKMFSPKMESFFGREARTAETNLDSFHMNVAASLQVALEKALIHLVTHFQKQTQLDNLCLAGGVALNCVANSKLLKETGFKNIWIQPSAGDAGGSLGAALAYWHLALKQERKVHVDDAQKGSYLGPEFSEVEIESFLMTNKVPFQKLKESELLNETCRHLEEQKIIGWFQGRMEFGPRALGHRSIIGDARVLDLQKTMNLKIKFRESFRPFAPIVLEEDAQDIFDFPKASPYMLFVAPIRKDYCLEMKEEDQRKFGIDKLNVVRSKYPAITHVDYSARLQTVSQNRSPLLHQLLTQFKQRNEKGILVNTSFNVRGEPIVCTPQDAYRCFRRTEIDVLIIGPYVITKDNLPAFNDTDWRSEFELD